MKLRKTDFILSICCILMISLFFISNIAGVNSKHERKGVKTALLNPSKKDKVAQIQIKSSSKNIFLSKIGEFWTVSGELDTPSAMADKSAVNLLIENSIKLRMLYTISDSINSWSTFSLDETSSICILFLDKDTNLLSKIYFGNTDNLTNRIYIRTEKKLICYETEDDFSSSLTKDISSWCNPLVLQFVDSKSGVSSISLSSGLSAKPINSDDNKFDSISNKLLSLRHGKAVEYQNAKKIQETMTPSAKLTVESGSGRVERILFYKNKDKNSGGNIYIMNSTCTPSPADNAEIYRFLRSEHVMFYISSWTYEKIKSICTQEN